MAKHEAQKLTVRVAAERLGMAIPTVTLWCRAGKFPNAEQVDTPRGPVWYIPEADLAGAQPRGRGRPPKHPADTTRELNTAFKKAAEAARQPAKRRGRKAA